MLTSGLVSICILYMIKNVYFVAFFAIMPCLWEKFHKFAKLFLKSLNITCIYIQAFGKNRHTIDYSLC